MTSQDQRCLLVSSLSNVITAWDPLTDSARWNFVSASNVNCVRWNHTNQVVGSSGDDGAVYLHHHSSGNQMGRLPELAPDEPERAGSAMAESISCIAFSKGSRYLATAGSGSTVKVWDLKRKVMVKSLSGHTERVNAVTYSGGDSHIASAGTSGQILLHAQLSGTCVGEIIAEPASGVNALQYSTHALSRHLLAAASDNGSVHVWDSTVRSLRAQFLDVHTARATSLAFSPSAATTLVSGGLDKRVQWLDVATCSAVHTLLVEAPVTSVAIK
eukprot:gene29202-36324_t